MADQARTWPATRETADHSLPFLVAAALQDGDVGVAQFEGERWLRPDTRSLMGRISLVADPALNEHAASTYPAVVTVTLRSSETLRAEMLRVPGSPSAPLTGEELRAKLGRISSRELPVEVEDALVGVGSVADVGNVGRMLRNLH